MRSLILLLPAILFNGCQIEGFGTSEDTTEHSIVREGSVQLYWSQPLERVNGDSMTTTEVGGYEVRYKSTVDDAYAYITIDSSTTQYSFDNLVNPDDYVFQVAVFDTDGIYSNFVTATIR